MNPMFSKKSTFYLKDGLIHPKPTVSAIYTETVKLGKLLNSDIPQKDGIMCALLNRTLYVRRLLFRLKDHASAQHLIHAFDCMRLTNEKEKL